MFDLEKQRDLPLYFELNQGQVNDEIEYIANLDEYFLLLAPDKITIFLGAKRGYSSSERLIGVKLINISNRTKLKAELKLKGRVNYFIGNEPDKWLKNIPTFSKIIYNNIYQGIDLACYFKEGYFKHDFIVRPQANPDDILLEFTGIQEMELNPQGDLILYIKDESIILKKPVIYQEFKGVKQKVEGSYKVLDNKQVKYQIGKYDKNQLLIIDPALVYNKSMNGYSGSGIEVDDQNNLYLLGDRTVIGYLDNKIKNDYNKDKDNKTNNKEIEYRENETAYILKLDLDTHEMIYLTHIGGNDLVNGQDFTRDHHGNLYLTGYTRATNFPCKNQISSFKGGDDDIFISQLSSDGTELKFSSYLGGIGWDNGSCIAVDSQGNIYIGGDTQSTDFPVKNPIYNYVQARNNKWDDYVLHPPMPFVSKIDPIKGELTYSTYLVGTGSVDDITVDKNGNAYITGATGSKDYPVTDSRYNFKGGNLDAFLTILNSEGTGLVFSGCLGGNKFERGEAINLDKEGNIFLAGYTGSEDFPTKNQIFKYSGNQKSYNMKHDGFVLKMDSNFNLIYSTYLGNQSSILDIAVDNHGCVYVTGITQSTYFPLKDPFYSYSIMLNDGVISKINPDGSQLEFSSYLGLRGSNSVGSNITLDQKGDVYLTGHHYGSGAFLSKVSSVDYLYPAWKYDDNYEKRWGYLDNTGKFVIKPKFDIAEDFHNNGFAVVWQDGYQGIIDRNGEYLLEPVYGNLRIDTSGFIIASQGKKSKLFDLKGKMIFETEGAIGKFKEGRAVFEKKTEKGSRYGYINSFGISIEAKYLSASNFEQGKGLVQLENTQYALINWEGILARFDYSYVGDHSEGLLTYKKDYDSPTGYINEKGEVVIEAKFVYAEPFKKGLAKVIVDIDGNKKVGLIDKSGEYVIKPAYDDLKRLGDDLFAVGLSLDTADELDQKGYIYAIMKKDGNLLISDFLYSDVEPFKEGVASVSSNLSTFFIDKNAVKVSDLPTVEGKGKMTIIGKLIKVEVDNELYYLDKTGEIIWQPQTDIKAEVSEDYQVGLKVVEKKYCPNRFMLVYYPQLSGLDDDDLQKQLNEKFIDLSHFQSEVKLDNQFSYSKSDDQVAPLKLDDQASSLKLSNQLLGDPFYYTDYEYSSDFVVEFFNQDLLTLVISNYKLTFGRFNPLTEKTFLNINLNNGKSYRLQDLFSAGANYKENLNRIIKDILKKRNHLGTDFPGVREDHDFIVKKDKLVIYFRPYQLTFYPFFADFHIAYSQLMEIIDSDSQLWKSIKGKK